MNNIDEKRVYTLNSIVTEKLWPFAKSYSTARKIVLEDLALPKAKQILKTIVIGDGLSRTYRIKGEGVKKMLTLKS